MASSETNGIIGVAGDLGRQLARDVNQRYGRVIGFDLKPDDMVQGVSWWPDVEDVFEDSSLVHWCAPIATVPDVPELREDQMLVLHDSLMGNSQEAAAKLRERDDILGSIAVVHFLMNDEKTVVVSSESDEEARITDHIERLGWHPISLSPEEHDLLMAGSQGLEAALVQFILPALRQYADRGLLTRSGRVLKAAHESRASAWTPTSLDSILSNPYLPKIFEELADEVRKYQAKSLDKAPQGE